MAFAERRMILLGGARSGKSTSGNTILGRKKFKAKCQANPVTTICKTRGANVNGRNVFVTDTPGLLGTNNDESIRRNMVMQLIECAPGIDTFIIVIKIGGFSPHDNETLQKLLDTFKEESVLKHTVILFTYGNDLEGITIEEYARNNVLLLQLLDKCRGRYHVFDNTHWKDCDSGFRSNKVQVENLLKTSDELVERYGCYTNELLRLLNEVIPREMMVAQCDEGKAKENVIERILKQVVGITTGVLVGAVMGVPTAVAALAMHLVSTANKQGQPGARSTQNDISLIPASAALTANVGRNATLALQVATGAAVVAGGVVGGYIGMQKGTEAHSCLEAMKNTAEATVGVAIDILKSAKEASCATTKTA